MKISPIDIRQHTFEKGFRGYNVEEVNAFLNSLSQEWERVLNESKMLKMQLEMSDKELNKLKDVEMTLFRTLKTAEETSGQITDQANKAAEKYLGESRRKSDDIVNDAKRRASMLVQDAENQSKYVKDRMLDELKNQERDYKAMEKYRDSLIVQLKALVSTTNDTVERFEKKFSKDSAFAQKVEEVQKQVLEANSSVNSETSKEELSDVQAADLNVAEQVETEQPEEEPQEILLAAEESDTTPAETLIEQKTDDVAAIAEEVETASTEAEVADTTMEGKSEAVDVASETLVELEKMKAQRAADLEEEHARKSKEAASSVKKDAAENGSFFDQIK